MIVTSSKNDASELLVITQNDHAHFAAELLSLWRRDHLPDHPRRRELLLAAREHDNGWRETDSAPSYNPKNGLPYDFLSLPNSRRLELWHRGTRRLRHREPWVCALIVQHALCLHRENTDLGFPELLAEWRELRLELLKETELELGDLELDYRWIDLSDHLSLALSSRWKKSFYQGGYHVDVDGSTLFLNPFPLAGATTFRIPCRNIPNRPYRSDTDLGMELATARWSETSVRLLPK
jgi:hypothetical protein